MKLKKIYALKNNLKQMRKKRGYSQEELSILSLITRNTYNSIENGKRIPTGIVMLQISKALKESVERIFRLEEKE